MKKYTTRTLNTLNRNKKLQKDFLQLDKQPLSRLVSQVPKGWEGNTKTDYVMKVLTEKYNLSEITILRILSTTEDND